MEDSQREKWEVSLDEYEHTKSKRPTFQSNKPYPYIAKEDFDALPDCVKETIRQQHGYYQDLIHLAQAGTLKRSKSQNQRSVNFTRVQSEEDFPPYLQKEGESGQIMSNTCQEDLPEAKSKFWVHFISSFTLQGDKSMYVTSPKH